MMLQKAAKYAYPWWWASHIRTKQSKWLEQNLQDIEEKITGMLKIIDDDGDSFAKRAEMYFRQRPDLVIMVEETYRAYRALAERYDHLSKDLQRANRTIAYAFPEQVPFAMDEEDEENGSQASTACSSSEKPGVSKPSIPKAPFADKDFRSQHTLLSRKGQAKKALSSAKTAAAFTSSGLSENEAVVEIDKLQKEILDMEAEAEFVRSSYEQGYEKFCEMQNQIAEKQKKLCSLQDEFEVGSIIDDNEAETLMATRALKSCQDSLARLKEKHEQSTEEARVESRRIKGVNQKFEALKNKFNSPNTDQQEKHKSVINMVYDYEIDSMEKEKQDSEVLRKEILEKLEASSNHSLTLSQLVEKIDDLVQRVVNLETAVFSENALVKRLKSEVNELQTHVKSLEEDKEAVIEGSDITNKRMNELEVELSRVRDLVKTVIDQNNSLKTHFTEASCNVNHLAEKLKAVKMEEEVEIAGLSHDRKSEEHPVDLARMEGKERDASPEGSNYADSESSNKFDVDSEKGLEPMEEDKAEKKYFSETASSIPDAEIEELETDEDEEEQPRWRQMYLNGLDDREKILQDERSSVLRNYKEVREKLNEVDKQNREGFFELALQIKELKNALASRDGQIQSLRRKKSSGDDENKYGNVAEHEAPRLSASQESTLTDSIQTSPGRIDESPKKIENVMQVKPVNEPGSALTIADKIRSDIDGLLEENLEFWLRFSTTFHQIHKYQASIQDLKAEISKLRDKRKQKGNEEHLKSEARPIYCHLREIKTELTLWLQNNAVLKDEVQGRYSSLCNIQEEIARVTKVSGHAGETKLNGYQAAKFQGEVLNMKQENKKVCDELKAGFARVRQLKHEVERVMVNLERELGAAASATQRSGSTTGRRRIPLRSFLFGIKLKNKRPQKVP